MDIYLNRRERDNNYFFVLVYLVVNDLMKIVKIVFFCYIKDFFFKVWFESEVK